MAAAMSRCVVSQGKGLRHCTVGTAEYPGTGKLKLRTGLTSSGNVINNDQRRCPEQADNEARVMVVVVRMKSML